MIYVVDLKDRIQLKENNENIQIKERHSKYAGGQLKSVNGWFNTKEHPDGNGRDAFGFNGIPAGMSAGGGIINTKLCAYWWSQPSLTDDDVEIDPRNQVIRCIDYTSGKFIRTSFRKSLLLSVRCIKD